MDGIIEICTPSNAGQIDFPPVFDKSVTMLGKGVYASIIALEKSGFMVSYEKLTEMCGKKHQVEAGVRELKEAGYLAISRPKDARGRFLGYSKWRLYPYANGAMKKESTPSSEESKRKLLASKLSQSPSSIPKPDIRGNGSGKPVENPETPVQSLIPIYGVTVEADSQNPTSIPNPEIRGNGGENHKTKLNPCKGPKTEGISKDSTPKERYERMKVKSEEGFSFVLRHASEEQVLQAFEIAKGNSKASGWDERTQLGLSRERIDGLFEGYPPGDVLRCIERVAEDRSATPAKNPSFWFGDRACDVRRMLEASRPFERPTEDDGFVFDMAQVNPLAS